MEFAWRESAQDARWVAVTGTNGKTTTVALAAHVLRAAGLEGTDYTTFLENLRQTLPVITAMGVLDCDGNWYKNGDETPYDELLNEYNILEYNNAFGGNGKSMETFTLKIGFG